MATVEKYPTLSQFAGNMDAYDEAWKKTTYAFNTYPCSELMSICRDVYNFLTYHKIDINKFISDLNECESYNEINPEAIKILTIHETTRIQFCDYTFEFLITYLVNSLV